MKTLNGKVALITGAGSGLGRQLALNLAAERMAIAAIDLRPEGLKSLADELSGKPFAWAVADVTDRSALVPAVAQVEQRVGPTQLLIASAGIGIETSALNFNAADVEAIIRVNLIGVVNTIDAVLRGMIARRQGHLVGISSLASFRGLPRMAGYCASKAGLNALLDGLRVELRPLGIVVTTICPGWIRTPLTDNVQVPMPHILEVGDAARRIVGAIRRQQPFFAFPGPPVRRLRFLRCLPTRWSDWLLYHVLRSLADK